MTNVMRWGSSDETPPTAGHAAVTRGVLASPLRDHTCRDERKPNAEYNMRSTARCGLTRCGTPAPSEGRDYDESAPSFLPDGKWLAYILEESGWTS